MNRAFELAESVDPHNTAPNPRVGCVVVKNREIIAEGVHEKCGKEHAESNACKDLETLEGCEVYITLEPCHHFPGKKTPSCSDIFLQKIPEKIYVGALDPTFQGKNIERLRAAGITVEVMDFEARNKRLNPFFPRKKRPYVCLKLAQTLDGKIALEESSYPEGKPYISSESSRKKVHELRTQYSAILTTTETVLSDDPLLNVRLEKNPRNFSDPTIFVLGDRELPKNLRIFSVPGRKVVQIPRKPLAEALEELWTIHKIDSVMTEGGSWLCSELLAQDLIDEIQVFIAPKIAGKGKDGFQHEKFLRNFRLTETKNLEKDLFLRFLFV